MPDCDEVGLQEYRNKGLEKSVGFVLKHVKHIQTFLAPDAIQSSDFTICDFRFVCFSLHLYEDPLPFSGFHEFLHHPSQQDMTISDIMNSAFGSAGQRCMAASILIIVGKGQWEPWKVENWESTCGWMESWEWFLGSLNNHEAPLIRPCFPRGTSLHWEGWAPWIPLDGIWELFLLAPWKNSA